MNKLWVWVGFPLGIGVLLLLLVIMGSEAGAEGIRYITVKTEDGRTGKLGINDKHIGTGPPVEKGDMVQVLYTGKLKNGKQFDTNKKPGGKPMPVQVGGGNVIPGFDEGLVGMKKGGVRQLIIPPELGYGEQGNEKIPPNSELHFEIELLQIQRMPPMQMPKGHP